ncbi:MAG: NAD-dependent deacylase [Alphaproteobacteria bacterium]
MKSFFAKHRVQADAPIVILTGAGISAESGLETFRGAGGLWCGHRVEDVATPEAFARDPALVHEFYNMRRRGLLNEKIKPNPAHEALARLEQEWAGPFTLITQNIDDLHERAGSKNLIHMHGEALRVFCTNCLHKTEWKEDLSAATACMNCGYTQGLRPDIVWFGEMPYHMESIFEALSDCALFLSIGTSGNVYPAAGFVNHVLGQGGLAVELNLEPSLNSTLFHASIGGPAGPSVWDFVKALLAQT